MEQAPVLVSGVLSLAFLGPAVHGAPGAQAQPSAKRIMESVAQVYASCRSYQDRGVIQTEYRDGRTKPRTETLSFKTAFVRSDRFRFEFKKGAQTYIVWADQEAVRGWLPGKPVSSGSGSLAEHLDRASVPSARSADIVPSLLLPAEIGSRLVSSLGELELVGEELLGGALCFKLQANHRDGHRYTLWVEEGRFLLGKLSLELELQPEGGTGDQSQTKTTIMYDSVMNEPVEPSLLMFVRRR